MKENPCPASIPASANASAAPARAPLTGSAIAATTAQAATGAAPAARPLACSACGEPVHRAAWENDDQPGVQVYAHDTAAAMWACPSTGPIEPAAVTA